MERASSERRQNVALLSMNGCHFVYNLYAFIISPSCMMTISGSCFVYKHLKKITLHQSKNVWQNILKLLIKKYKSIASFIYSLISQAESSYKVCAQLGTRSLSYVLTNRSRETNKRASRRNYFIHSLDKMFRTLSCSCAYSLALSFKHSLIH